MHRFTHAAVLAALLSSLSAGFECAPALAQAVSVPWATSAWVKGHASATRLVAGARGDAAQRAVLAGIEIKLNDGWKTYWRHPGDAGGVPPAFDWSGSTNLRTAHVLFPAPDRLSDPNGDSIGYKKSVVFPVAITPVDPSRPVVLKLQLEYGICREICVPAEAKLDVTIPAGIASVPPDLTAALARVPHVSNERQPADPELKSATAILTGPTPGMSFDIATATAGCDLFVETEGTYLPMPKKIGEPSPGVQRFKIDLKGVDDLPTLKGKPLRLTVTTPNGGMETMWVVK